mgnify:CR=1 FL=1
MDGRQMTAGHFEKPGKGIIGIEIAIAIAIEIVYI